MVEQMLHRNIAHYVPETQDQLDSGSTSDINWHLLGVYLAKGTNNDQSPTAALTWVFDFDQIKEKGFDGLRGSIVVTLYGETRKTIVPLNVEVSKKKPEVRANLNVDGNPSQLRMRFEFILSFFKLPEDVDPDFKKSELTDGTLEVEGVYLHINKAYLTMHSEFFRALFSVNFSEGEKSVISIKEVCHRDFRALLKVIMPNPEFPNDFHAEKLLELADRFMLKSVTDHVEKHLLTESRLNNHKILGIADKYKLNKLVDHCIKKISSNQELGEIKDSSYYDVLSDETKAKILDRIIYYVKFDPLYEYVRPRTSLNDRLAAHAPYSVSQRRTRSKKTPSN